MEFVTENVSQFIKFTKEEVLGESIYNIIHHGDHARFSSTLLPMSVGFTSIEPNPPRSRAINCRFLIKAPGDQDETMEEKQTRVSKYENMQVSGILCYELILFFSIKSIQNDFEYVVFRNLKNIQKYHFIYFPFFEGYYLLLLL